MTRNKRAAGLAIAVLALAQGAGAEFDLTGGSFARSGDGKEVIQFTYGSGFWTIPEGVSELEVLVVGGGGGTWTNTFSSGSGAGGMYYNNAYAVTPGSIIGITVGAGATQGTGEASRFGEQLIAYGGTAGTNVYGIGGAQGGYSLDGGATVVPGTAGFYDPGYSDGDGSHGTWNFPSGSGAVGAGNADGGDGSAGGIGAQCVITTGEAITEFTPYYAGGGGGCANGLGGLGGGGNGSLALNDDRASSGATNTGGGGGGGWGGGGGAGGSGVVIVAYAVPEPGTVILLGIAFGGLFLRRRLRKA